jgi:hypothetical protein
VAKAKADPDDDSKPPNIHELATLLAGSHPAFLALTQRGPAFRCEWKRYSNKSPWVLKVSQGDRTLCTQVPWRPPSRSRLSWASARRRRPWRVACRRRSMRPYGRPSPMWRGGLCVSWSGSRPTSLVSSNWWRSSSIQPATRGRPPWQRIGAAEQGVEPTKPGWG